MRNGWPPADHAQARPTGQREELVARRQPETEGGGITAGGRATAAERKFGGGSAGLPQTCGFSVMPKAPRMSGDSVQYVSESLLPADTMPRACRAVELVTVNTRAPESPSVDE